MTSVRKKTEGKEAAVNEYLINYANFLTKNARKKECKLLTTRV